MTKIFDVAIIGYGPVGATLANLLGQNGWQVAIIEANSEIYPIPRAVHLDDEAQRIFQAADVLDLVAPAFGGYPPDRQYINATGKVFFETHLNTTKPFGYQSNMYFHQPTLEAGLRKGVARYSTIELYLNHAATQLTQDEEGVTIQATHTQNNRVKTVRAKYVVGCDGARSFVRKALGIQLRDLKFEQPWLVTDFYLKPGVNREDVGFPYAHQQICDPQQPISFIPNGTKDHYRFEFMLPKGVTSEEAEQEAYVYAKLAQVVDLEKIDLVRGAVYTFHSLIAQRWRVQRIFIAGDAAHQMPPFAGQGMCSGLRDVHNLGWKLGLVLAGRAKPLLLDSYETERKPHVTRMTQGAMFLGNLVQTQNPVRGWVRDALFQTLFKIPALFGRIAHFALRPPDLKTPLQGGMNKAVVGRYFIQPQVTDRAGNIVLLDALLGNGFVVLGMEVDPRPYFETLADQLPICTLEIAIGEKGTVQDHTGKLRAWFSDHQADFAVLRPDRFVFGIYSVENIMLAADELSANLVLLPYHR